MASLGFERRARPVHQPLTPLDVAPCTTFIFRYRPAEILHAADIMTPLPEISLSLASRRDEDGIDETDAEIAALQKTLKARISELTKWKG